MYGKNGRMIRKNTIKASFADKVFDFTNYGVLALLLLAVGYPLYFVVIASVSNPSFVQLGEVILWPKGVNIEGYRMILENDNIATGYRNTILYTFFGTLVNLALTLTCGYGLSHRSLPGRRAIMGIFTFTMFFSGGMIPTYILVRTLGLVNKPVVMIIIGAVSVWNIILARTFFESNIPVEMREAALIDGCNDFNFFFKIVLPLSTAITAVLTIYYAVGHWNQFLASIIYLRNRNYQTLQVFLRELLILDQFDENSGSTIVSEDSTQRALLIMSVKYGVIIVASLPMLMLYPFVQKYFVKGVMVGAVKG